MKEGTTIIIHITVILLVASLVAYILLSTEHRELQDRLSKNTEVDYLHCYGSPSGFLQQEGWQRVSEIDRQRIGLLVGENKAQVKIEQSLICHDYREGKGMRSLLVAEWWWRKK
jgi:hypothetical protein